MAGVRTARWGALLPVLLLLAVACASPAVADTTSGAGDDAGEPWRREANQDRDAELRGRLSALDNAREAEAEAAAREKSIGGEKLEEATKASKQAAAFMTKAEKLLASEDNLKDEESNVKERLDVLERGHHNLKRWNSCDAGDAGCTADQKDVWGPSAPEGAESDGRISSVLKSRKKKRKRTEAAPAPPAVFDPSPRGRPYSGKVWQDAKPVVEWATVKTSALRAGYELSNCFVAAEKDPSTVQVEIMDQRTFIVTKEGCKCMTPWRYYPETGTDVAGNLYESRRITTYEGCSTNGSDKAWCATTAACGHASEDAHAGLGPGQYGWTHWDYCSGKTKTEEAPVWSAKHSAGDVTCAADFLLVSDRAAEWRALELLRQEPHDASAGQVAPSEIASRYEKCIAKATTASSAVFCEADMLRLLPASVVRHALLISRSDSLTPHWANRQRVVLLYAKQLQSCLVSAEGAREGTVCISQMLSSLPAKIGQEAVTNGLDAQESGEAPEDVATLTARLVACVRVASDDDGLAFCAASFLTHAPSNVVKHAARIARRVKAFGSAGFPDTTGVDSGVGWVGFKHPVQVRGV